MYRNNNFHVPLLNVLQDDSVESILKKMKTNSFLKEIQSPNYDIENINFDFLLSVYQGEIVAVKILLDRGANIEYDNGEKTVLMIACDNHYPEIIRLLVSRGADVNAKIEYRTKDGLISNTVLKNACAPKSKYWWLREGEPKPLTDEQDLETVKFLIKSGSNDITGALLTACKWGDQTKQIIDFLLENFEFEQQILNEALWQACANGHPNSFILIDQLLKLGANKNFVKNDQSIEFCAELRDKDTYKDGSIVNLLKQY